MADPHTLQRELSSLYCFYNTIEKNETPPETDTLDVKFVDDVIKGIWGTDIKNLKEHDIYAYQYHGPALLNHLKSMGAPTSGYKYGIFEKDTSLLTSQKGVSMNTTNVFDDIWNMFDEKHRKLFATKAVGQKDSWNPADVYLLKGSSGTIIRHVKKIYDKHKDDDNPVVFVTLVNNYLTKLYQDKKLIGVSLKAAKPPNVPVAKEFNVVLPDAFESPRFGEAKIVKGGNGYVHQHMEVSEKNGALDFKGNSITFEAEISMDGGKPLKYFWESKSPGRESPHTTEMKDMVKAKKGNALTKANARGGSITKDIQFKPLIKEFTKKDFNHNVPVGETKWDKTDPPASVVRAVKYWSGIYLTLKKNPLVTLNDVVIKNKAGKEVVINGTRKGTMEYFYDLFWIDGHSSKDVKAAYGLPKSKKYYQNFRGKLRGFNIMRAVVKAEKEGRLGEFLVKAYYKAAKIKFNVNDLQGPYVKIQ